MPDNKPTAENFHWIRKPGQRGEMLFAFGDGTIYNLFEDYPYKLSAEEKRIFDELNPFWVNFFSDRQ